MSLDLSLAPVPTAAITESSLEELITHGIALINTLPSRTAPPSASTGETKISWSAGKGDAETKLWKATHNNEPWIARVTDLDGIGYAELWRRVVEEKSLTEKTVLMQPHDEIENVGEERVFGDIKVIDVHKLLHVQAFSAREFLETIVYKDLSPKDGPKCCIIISMPTAGEIKDPAHAHGVYTSVETLREVGDGKVEVIMSLTSNAGGNIPRWMQNMAMAGQILSDGQRFFKFLREQPKPAEV